MLSIADILQNTHVRRAGHLILQVIFGACLLFILYSLSLRLRMTYQWITGWGCFALLLLLKRISFFQEPPGRIAFLMIGAFVTLRYWAFRTFDSLLFISFTDSLGMILLYAAETYGIAVYFLGMFVGIWPLKRNEAPLPSDRSKWPTIDVFLPTYNESEEIIKTTAIACTQLDYPKDKLNICILDDGGTEEKRSDPNPAKSKAAWDRFKRLRSLAETLGISYMTREHNDQAKAGNINAALASMTGACGDLILILDCDHVPAKDLLKHTAGYFLKDEKLFLVQTPHFFINPNPVEKNLETARHSPGENEMFYGSIQTGMDFWNSSFFCGSAALLRRKYLTEIEGMQSDTVTEDAETAIALHAKGYNSVYVAKPMICGLSPETFGDFILQRSRWTQGMIQILLLKNPFRLKGLSLAQRLCYANSCIFWFFGLARLIFFAAPLLFLYFGIRVYNASEVQVLAYAVPHIFAGLLVTDYMYGRVRHPFFSELFEAVQSVFLVPTVLGVLINPRSPSFEVTPKGKSLKNDFLSPLAAPFYVLFFICVGGGVAAVWRWVAFPMEHFSISVCVFWLLFNLLLVLLCLGVVWELQQRRQHYRTWTEGEARLTIPRLQKSVGAGLVDVSLVGMGVEPRESVGVKDNEPVTIETTDSYGKAYSFKATIVQRQVSLGKTVWGCQFDVPDLKVLSELVSFVYGDSNRWARFWELKSAVEVGVMEGLVYLLRKSISGTMRHFRGILPLVWSQTIYSMRGLWENIIRVPKKDYGA